MHDTRFQYACGAGVRSFRPSWPPVIRFIAKFGCVLRNVLPLDAGRMLEFVHDLVTTIEQPTILPADALVAIFFAHGLKWPAAVGYFRDNLTGQARPWTASHFEEAIRHSITMSDGERRRNIFRGMNSSKRMHATTGLAVNGVKWGALAAHSAVSAAGPEGDTRTLVSLGVAGTLYEVRRTQELNATIEHIMDAAAMFVNGATGPSAMPRDAAEVINVLEALSQFYRRARGNRISKSLATHGYGCKHFTRIFLMEFQRVNPGVCDMATYKDLAEFIPDEGKHVPESVAELTCGELANLFDVGVGELPMWACLAGRARAHRQAFGQRRRFSGRHMAARPGAPRLRRRGVADDGARHVGELAPVVRAPARSPKPACRVGSSAPLAQASRTQAPRPNGFMDPIAMPVQPHRERSRHVAVLWQSRYSA